MMKFAKLAVLAPAAALAVWGGPLTAHAAGAGGGTVAGTVTGLNLNPVACAVQNVTFTSSTLLQGTLTDGNQTYVGTVTVSATAMSGPVYAGQDLSCENFAKGSGSVQTLTGTGSGTVVTGGVATSGTVTVGLQAGATQYYVRVGGAVAVDLHLTVQINTGPVVNAHVLVAAEFNPSTGQPALGPVTQADFRGVWAGQDRA